MAGHSVDQMEHQMEYKLAVPMEYSTAGHWEVPWAGLKDFQSADLSALSMAETMAN